MAIYLLRKSFLLLLALLASPLWQTKSYEQNPDYQGPSDCGEVLQNYYHLFSEYPNTADAASRINFLSMGDACSPSAERRFLDEMRDTFLNGTVNSKRMTELGNLWEQWRSYSDSGAISGRRICNPKRMLECHFSISACVCRSTLRLFDAQDYDYDGQIILEPVRVVKNVPNSAGVSETVIRCESRVDSICQWRVPWLGFCAIPCMNLNTNRESHCIGQSSGAKRCRVCDLNSGGVSEQCIGLNLTLGRGGTTRATLDTLTIYGSAITIIVSTLWRKLFNQIGKIVEAGN